jgi:hypothetical protein
VLPSRRHFANAAKFVSALSSTASKTPYIDCMANKRSADAISGPVIVAFIKANTEQEGPQKTRKVNGRPIGESLSRAIFRWRKEGVHPRLCNVEEALQAFGILFRDFEIWAKENDHCIWFNNVAPDWWTDESESLWRQDLKSSDPDWKREARDYGIAIGALKPRKAKPKKTSRPSRPTSTPTRLRPRKRGSERVSRQREPIAA